MQIDGIEYSLVVTSANEYDCLSMECCSPTELCLEAELVSYPQQIARLHFHKTPLPMALVQAFIEAARHELKYGGNDSVNA